MGGATKACWRGGGAGAESVPILRRLASAATSVSDGRECATGSDVDEAAVADEDAAAVAVGKKGDVVVAAVKAGRFVVAI